MHGVTIAAFATASVEVVASITDPAFAATGQALFGLVRSGFGSTIGNLAGGAVIREYGERTCYRGSAAIVMLGLAVYMAANWFGKARTPAAAIVEVAEIEEPSRCCPGNEVIGKAASGDAPERPEL